MHREERCAVPEDVRGRQPVYVLLRSHLHQVRDLLLWHSGAARVPRRAAVQCGHGSLRFSRICRLCGQRVLGPAAAGEYHIYGQQGKL